MKPIYAGAMPGILAAARSSICRGAINPAARGVRDLPDEDVGDMLVELANVAIGPEYRDCCCDDETEKCNGHNSQRQ